MSISMVRLFTVTGGAARIPANGGMRAGAADEKIVSDASAKDRDFKTG
jgi:hypothetical protein